MKLKALLKKILGESTVDMDPSVGNDNRFNQDVSNTQSMTSPGMRLMLTPGAAFGGNIAGISNVVLSNEARVALRRWTSLAKWAWAKYGNPNEFPPEVVQKLEDLGGAFERSTGPREPGTGYRPTVILTKTLFMSKFSLFIKGAIWSSIKSLTLLMAKFSLAKLSITLLFAVGTFIGLN